MKSSIVTMQEMNEKMKEEGETGSINSTKESRRWKEKSWTWTKNTKTEMKKTKKNMLVRIEEKQ